MAVVLPDVSILLLMAFAAVSIFSASAILRNRAIFRIFLRNAFGNRKRAALIIAGLMIGSAMISGALVMRSSMLQLSNNLVALSYGHVDETITDSGNSLYGAFFNYSAYSTLNSSLNGYSGVSAAVPMIYDTVSVLDNTTGVPYQDIGLVGTPWWSNSVLGNFISVNGSVITALPSDGMLIDELAAQQLDARAGNTVTVYFGPGVHYTGRIDGVVRDNYRGYFDSGFNLFMRLSGAQTAIGAQGRISIIAIANSGTVLSAASASNSVMKKIDSVLPSINSKFGISLAAYPLLQQQLNTIHAEISDLSDLYLALSLFAVATGLILVIVIFYMLAEERMRDLGTLRALGASRARIAGGFISEGFVYTAISCFIGSLLGIAIGFVMMYGFVALFGQTFSQPVRDTGILLASFSPSLSDVTTGFSAGGIATFAVIMAASVFISRFSVIDAIRRNTDRRNSGGGSGKLMPVLLIIGSILLLTGGYLTASLEISMLGLSLLILSSAWLAAAITARDYFAGIAGAGLLVQWGVPQAWSIFPDYFGYSYYIYVESGIFLVSGGILIFFSLEPLLLSMVKPKKARRGGISATMRQAIAFTTQKKVRTAISLALFSFVIFGIVSVSVLGSMVDQAAVQTVAKQSGGYNFVLYSGDGANITPAIENNSSLNRYIAGASLIYDTTTAFTAGSNSTGLFVYPLVGIPSYSGTGDFFSQNRYQFYSYLSRFSSPRSVWNAVENNSSLAVIDMTLAGIKQGNFGSGISANVNVKLGQTLTVYGDNHTYRSVVVAGILNEFGFQGVFVSVAAMDSLGLRGSSFPVLFIRLSDGVSPTAASVQIRKALTEYNPVLLNLYLITQQLTMDINGIVEMTEIFIAMGLVAGTAGLGIIAMRSVVERYQSIGLLRALGFTRRMVGASFLIEFIFIAVSGSAIGVIMSLINGNIIASRLSPVLTFTYSPASVAYLVAISATLTILAVISSVRAVSRIEPSAAIRYIE
jgi:putative ABC transport system permease protein